MSELFLKTVNMSISASWLILAVFVLRLILKKAPKWVNVLLWGIVAVRLLCPFSFESMLSLIPSAETIPLDIGMDTTPAINSGVSSINAIVNPMISGSNTPALGASVNPLQITIGIYANLWFLGLLAMGIYTSVSYWGLRKKVATAIPLRENIFQSENVSSPFVLGVVKPRIYLPFGGSDQDTAHVIAHEQAHIQRKDHWWKPLGFLLLSIHWFNPLMWIAYLLLCRDIELACDEKVIRKLDNHQKADYSQALLTCAVNRRAIAACPLAFGEVGVKERVRNVLNYKKPSFWLLLIAIVTCVAVAVCFLTDPVEEEELCTLDARIVSFNGDWIRVESLEEDHLYDEYDVSITDVKISDELKRGDHIQIRHNGLLQEVYPPRMIGVSEIVLVARMARMINVNGYVYVDSGEPIPGEIEPAHILGTLHTQVADKPRNHGQGNFDCVGCQYAWTEAGIAVLIDNEWYLFTEEVIEFPEYYLTIPVEGVMSISMSIGGRGGIMYQETFTPYEKGVPVLLEIFTGKERLFGARVRALDKDNQELFYVSISAKDFGTADGIMEKDGWVITPVRSAEERDELFLSAELAREEERLRAMEENP